MKEKVVGYGVPEERVSVIPNYVDTMLFRPLEGQEGGKARIVFIGRLSAQKNPLLLLEALEGLDLELDMVGDGDLRATAEREAARPGVKARLHGNLPHQNLPEMSNAVRLFVLPSSYDRHPKTLLKALVLDRKT